MEFSLYTLLGRELPLEKVIDIARKCGIRYIDLRQAVDGVHIGYDVKENTVKEIKKLAEDKGINFSGVTTYYRIGMIGKEKESNLEGIRKSLRLAGILNAPYLRISAPPGEMIIEHGYEKIRERIREDLLFLEEEGGNLEVTLTMEQHGYTACSSAGQIVDCFRGLNLRWVGVVYDPGNTLFEGYERPEVQIEMLYPLIRNVHVKNALFKGGKLTEAGGIPFEPARIDNGALDWGKIIKYLKRKGYSGFFTLEDFSPFSTLEEKVAYNRKRILEYWNSAK